MKNKNVNIIIQHTNYGLKSIYRNGIDNIVFSGCNKNELYKEIKNYLGNDIKIKVIDEIY